MSASHSQAKHESLFGLCLVPGQGAPLNKDPGSTLREHVFLAHTFSNQCCCSVTKSCLHSRLPRGVRPRFEGKPRTPLSSRVATRVSWSLLSGLKGVQPPLPFGERTRDCSLGHAGKEGPQLARTGASQGFPRAAAPVGVVSRGTTRISGSLSCGAREVRSPCAWRGGARPGSRVTGGD